MLVNKQVPLSSTEENKEVNSCYKETSKEKKRFLTILQCQSKVGNYVVINGTNYTLDCTTSFNKYYTKKWYFLWNVTKTIPLTLHTATTYRSLVLSNSLLQDNSSLNTGVHIVLYKWWCFRLIFPYCTCIIKISIQKLCVTIKRWLPRSIECSLINRVFMRNLRMFSVMPISRYTVILTFLQMSHNTCYWPIWILCHFSLYKLLTD